MTITVETRGKTGEMNSLTRCNRKEANRLSLCAPFPLVYSGPLGTNNWDCGSQQSRFYIVMSSDTV